MVQYMSYKLAEIAVIYQKIMSQSELVITEDGSHSLRDARTGETYHSKHGAVQESRHIFIERGLHCCSLNEIEIFEVGFGTGLNAYLSWMEAEKNGINLRYTSVELYPLAQSEWEKLNFESVLSNVPEPKLSNDSYEPVTHSTGATQPATPLFQQLHTCSWGSFHQLSPCFSFRKLQVDFSVYTPDRSYDLIYFDAFSPEKQPELWLPERFATLARHCNRGAILTTYCAKGIVKQALRDAGFTVERLKGPPGKRHMLRGRWLE